MATLSTVVLGLAGIALLLVAIRMMENGAPEGYEDEDGFHFGREPLKGRIRRDH